MVWPRLAREHGMHADYTDGRPLYPLFLIGSTALGS